MYRWEVLIRGFGMLSRFIGTVIGNPRLTLLIVVLATMLAGVGYKNLWLNTDYKIFFDKDDALLSEFQKQEITFSKSDTVVIAVEAKGGDIFDKDVLEAIDELTRLGWESPYSMRVDSITNYNHTWGHDDELMVEQILKDPANLTPEKISEAKEIILGSSTLKRLYVNDEGSSATVVVTYEFPDVTEPDENDSSSGQEKDQFSLQHEVDDFMKDVVAKVSRDHPGVKMYVTGTVVNAVALSEAVFMDMETVFPLSYFLMIVFLVALMRSVISTVMVLGTVTITVVFTLGIKCFFDGTINAINVFSPVIIMVIAASDCIHILTSFLKKYRHGYSKYDAIEYSLKQHFKAIFLTTATTVVGFLGMNFHDSPVYRELGNIVAFGVFMAFIFCLTFLPSLCLLLPIKKDVNDVMTSRIIPLMSDFVSFHYKKILAFSVVFITAILVIGLPRNEINELYLEYLDESFDYRKANNFINENITGLHRLAYAMDSGDQQGIHDPEYQRVLDEFTVWLQEQPEVSHVTSYTDIVKKLNKAMNGNLEEEYKLPGNRELASQYSLLYELSLPFGQGLTNQVSLDKRYTLLSVVLWQSNSNTVLAFNDRVDKWLEEHAPPSMHAMGTGLDLMYSNLAEKAIPSMVFGTFASYLLISFLLIFALNSLKLGALSILTNLLPAGIAFALWGIVDGRIGIGVATVATVTLGLVVDDTIHFLHRYKMCREAGSTVKHAIYETHASTGMAIITTSLVFAAGFATIGFSHYRANADMGILTSITILVAMIVDLVVIPALLLFLVKDDKGKATPGGLEQDIGLEKESEPPA